MKIEKKIAALGLDMPALEDNYRNNPSGAKYVSHYAVGEVLYLSGCTPTKDGAVYLPGVLGESLSVEDGYQAARQAMLCYFAMLKYALGDLDRIGRFLHMVGYVNSGEGFNQQPGVINGAVDLMTELYGEAGMPTRAAIGCRGLAMNNSVELILTVQFDGGEVSTPLARNAFHKK